MNNPTGVGWPVVTRYAGDARLDVFNPLVPGDADASGHPALVYRVQLRNHTDRAAQANVCGSVQNVIGRHRGPYEVELRQATPTSR